MATRSYEVTRPDGTKITRTIETKKTSSGRKISTVTGGLDGGVRLSEKNGVVTKQSANLTQELEAEKKAQEELIKKSNISLAEGGVGISKVTFTDQNAMSVDANQSVATGGIRKVTYDQSFKKAEDEQRKGLLGYYDKVNRYIPPEERKKLNTAERVGNFLLGRVTPEEVKGGSPFDLIVPAGAVSIVGKGRQASKAVPFVQRLTSTTVKTGSRAAKVDSFIVGSAKTLAVGTGIVEGSKQVGLLTSNKTIRNQLAEQGFNYREVEKELFRAGRQAQFEQASAASSGINIPKVGKLNKETVITGLNPLLGSRGAFEQGVSVKGAEFGLTPTQAKEFAGRQRQFRGYGELAGLFSLNVGTEFLGTGFVAASKTFQKGTPFIVGKAARKELFKTSFLQIGKAGAVEGVGDVLITSRSRSEKITPGKLALGAGLGFGTAGLLGGGIVATQAGKPVTSKGLYALGSFLDPFEFPSDQTAGLLRKAGFGKGPQASIAKKIGKKGQELFKIGGIKTRSFVPGVSFTPAPLASKTPSTTKTTSLFSGFVNIPGVKTPASIFGKTFTPLNVFGSTTTNTPLNVFGSTTTNTPANVFGSTTTNTNTQTSVTTPSTVNIPSSVSIPRALLPPPLLPGGFPQGGSGGRGGKNKSTFVNELNNALNFLSADINTSLQGRRRKK